MIDLCLELYDRPVRLYNLTIEQYVFSSIIFRERQFSRANREAQRKIKEAEIKKKFHEEKVCNSKMNLY